MIPAIGSRWRDTNGTKFHILHTIELEGKMWVHYIKEDVKNPQEYSCYLESFLERFTEILND